LNAGKAGTPPADEADAEAEAEAEAEAAPNAEPGGAEASGDAKSGSSKAHSRAWAAAWRVWQVGEQKAKAALTPEPHVAHGTAAQESHWLAARRQ
jgi:hypothetical protein